MKGLNHVLVNKLNHTIFMKYLYPLSNKHIVYWLTKIANSLSGNCFFKFNIPVTVFLQISLKHMLKMIKLLFFSFLIHMRNEMLLYFGHQVSLNTTCISQSFIIKTSD